MAADDDRSVRMVVTTDWDAGFLLTLGSKPLDDVRPGGEYVVECTPQHDVVLQDITVRDFVLDRLYVGKLFVNVVADEELVATGSVDDRRYGLEPPVPVATGENIRAILKNVSDAPKKPKVAVLLRGDQDVANAALKDWRVVGVHVDRAAKPLSPSCPTCDAPDRDVRRQLSGAVTAFCGDVWHDASETPAKESAVHAPKIVRTLHGGPGNATLVSGCSCGAEAVTTKAFADHVGLPEPAIVAMLGLVGVIYDLCDYSKEVTREEVARRVARCLEFSR